ncbi:MAG: GNAT family N-acetyltransferase [Candidatus Hermodarchaeota archaeon]
MLQIEKVNENNQENVIEYLKQDVVKHVFAFNDLQYDPEHTTMYVAFENGRLKGYILIYTALQFPSVFLECELTIAKKLIDFTPKNQFIMHPPPNLLSIIKQKFPKMKHYVENWMFVKKGEGHFLKSALVHRLCSEDDAAGLALLLSTRSDRSPQTAKKYFELIKKNPTYGVFINDKLVSYASSFIQLPQVWMIGGVYTHQDERNKGYATLATSAVTEEALKNSKAAALFVRSDNYPAVRTYEKIGYKTIDKRLWVDVGTGIKP